MIINIPIQVDEKAIEEKALTEYKHDVDKMLLDRIENVLIAEADNGWRYNKATPKEGMQAIVHRAVDRYVDNYVASHTEEIIDKAVEKLERRLMNRKRIKEVGDEL